MFSKQGMVAWEIGLVSQHLLRALEPQSCALLGINGDNLNRGFRCIHQRMHLSSSNNHNISDVKCVLDGCNIGVPGDTIRKTRAAAGSATCLSHRTKPDCMYSTVLYRTMKQAINVLIYARLND
jgi:hypothetical protein